jgi:type I restriction-modification system DNA methylase subunit
VTKSPIEGAFQRYLQEIKKSVLKGDYTEMTLRTPLENFIKALNSDYDVTHEAKRIKDLGGPDFTAYRSKINIGYIEAKELGKDLDEVLESIQIKRYRESIDNIILTDYRRFILIRGNRTIFDQSLFSQTDVKNPKSRVSETKIDEFLQLIDTFFGYSQPTIKSAKVLAEELAKKTKLLKDLATEQLLEDLEKVEQDVSPSPLYEFYEALLELIKDISIEDCADAYAQTLSYGLFLASYYHDQKLDRDSAYRYIPKNIAVIRRIFSSISGDYLPANVSWIVDDIINILNASEIEEILTQISVAGKATQDPFYIFYEDFLAFYEPEKRKHMGVYYTPAPVVKFIVRSVHNILKNKFDKLTGLADDTVTLLDPSVGTGTFLSSAITTAFDELRSKELKGLIPKKIEKHILQDFYGFEILITPYIISHLKLTVLLNYYHPFSEGERVRVYLTNTLDPFETHYHMTFLRELSEESETADRIKLNEPILIVVGNPPYSVSSSNKSAWITTKMQAYKEGLHEKNIQPLDDDYLKFIRFAHWKIEQNGQGVIGFITNNGYLDGLIHRQMRQELLNTFDHVWIVNLHGNARKREKAPDGSPDQNVFDIQQGVSIIILVKHPQRVASKVYYCDLYGLRESKYEWLEANTIDSVEWTELHPQEPHYFFVPIDFTLESEYMNGWSITDIFQLNGPAVETGRDKFTVKWTIDEVWQTVTAFIKMDPETAREAYHLKEDTRDWKVAFAQRDLVSSGMSKERVTPLLYKPFDKRYSYYTGHSRGFHRMPSNEVMQHMMQSNIGLVAQKQTLANHPCSYFLVSDVMPANRVIRSDSVGRESFFPLYVYSKDFKERRPNFSSDFTAFFKQTYGETTTAEDVLSYIYAILYCPTFREKYCELLRIDFPRIPFTEDDVTFKKLSQLGSSLIDLHLMKRQFATTTTFDVPGSNVMQFVRYNENRVQINTEQFFDGISEHAWSFTIGSYHVLYQWLKSRKGRELSSSEIEHFLQIVEVVKKTIDLMTEIDTIIDFDGDFQGGTQTIKTAALNSDLSSY